MTTAPTPKVEDVLKKARKEAVREFLEIEPAGMGALFSPEGVIMLSLAGLLDLIGIILFIFGLDDFGITDIFGIILIGGWMLIRTVTSPEKMKEKVLTKLTGAVSPAFTTVPVPKTKTPTGLKKLFRGPWKRFLTPLIGEVIPYVGVLPMWTLAVYYELTS